ncbi:MAG TPA: MarR family winged helix-turn-helix transcriptional regulator [Pusillimonas sp.]|uniref:MarR family winged helix-turn-helix transcriptional regulator n=1 Tax=Pusillimonas sp. TaxID=3040095 RepID=UPI002CA6E367|nr:MarR family winged helix-turn-helix transcriptional regulator [Pusillimonas sp.]HUH88645.1 MarR family winged helix-turn-helix transcriptional regulator [Pusillimonas sp.]
MSQPKNFPAPVDIKLDYVTFKIDVVNERAKAVASKVYEAQVGLSLRELRLMRFIATQPGLTVSRLIEQTHIEKTLTSKAIAGLVARKLILRAIDPGDARQTNLYLTADGIKRVKDADLIGRQMEANMMSVLCAEETTVLKRCLEKLYALHEDPQRATEAFLKPAQNHPPQQDPIAM